MTSKSITLLTAAAVLLLGMTGFSSTAVASTPDGETPANEGVCDILKVDGITKGLYGLCNAYCEAQDLDTFDKGPPNVKILANYNKKKQPGDPDMPCLQVPCPCWSDAELATITSDGMAAACPASTGKIQIINNAPKTHFADADTNTGSERCRYIDLNVAPPTVRSFSISPEEAQACFAAVTSACQSVGL